MKVSNSSAIRLRDHVVTKIYSSSIICSSQLIFGHMHNLCVVITFFLHWRILKRIRRFRCNISLLISPEVKFFYYSQYAKWLFSTSVDFHRLESCFKTNFLNIIKMNILLFFPSQNEKGLGQRGGILVLLADDHLKGQQVEMMLVT